MTSQIIKKKIPINILINLFNKLNILHNNNYYIFDYNCYKKAIHNNLIVDFLNEIKEYYHKSKLFYLERKHTYTSLLTIIRHICKNNNIPYTSKIKYSNSNYSIIYYILLENNI